MIVLGIIDSKPASAAILNDGKILAAIAEERLCRMKLASGTPLQAIAQVMKDAGVSPGDIDQVAVAQKVSVFEPEPIPWKGWFEDEELKTRRFDNLSSRLAPQFGRIPFSLTVHHQLKRLVSRERTKKLPQLIRNRFGINAPVKFYDHHYCHATSAYYTSEYNRALVVTLDGGGDFRSGSVYLGENGHLRPLASIDSFHSLGNFYSYITELCGFKAEKHEGKITGLAAVGEPIYANTLRRLFSRQHPGTIRYSMPMYHRSALNLISEQLPANFDRADLAASAQLILEEIGTEFIHYWLRKTGSRNIIVAGGVFANVKFNQRVHELPEVDNIFVQPAMDDGGLSIGSALAALAEQPYVKPENLKRRLVDVFLGPEYDDNEIERLIRQNGCHAIYCQNIHEEIASLLAKGYVLARFTGRMEFGPRALGNRSLLYQTTDPTVNDWLNHRLNRTEFMPFAPATLQEYAQDCYENLAGAEESARFMTITFNCTPLMQKLSPGVVHIDGTARPQIIDEDTAPDFYKILSRYHQLTGIPSLINTSFNLHGEPIVCTPQDAIRSFRQGKIEYMAMGNWLVSNEITDELSEARFNRELMA